jgi:hypothetical protein
MFITKRELKRRIDAAVAADIARRERARLANERIVNIENDLCRLDERLARIETERAAKAVTLCHKNT